MRFLCARERIYHLRFVFIFVSIRKPIKSMRMSCPWTCVRQECSTAGLKWNRTFCSIAPSVLKSVLCRFTVHRSRKNAFCRTLNLKFYHFVMIFDRLSCRFTFIHSFSFSSSKSLCVSIAVLIIDVICVRFFHLMPQKTVFFYLS